eukprot:gene376-488_t
MLLTLSRARLAPLLQRTPVKRFAVPVVKPTMQNTRARHGNLNRMKVKYYIRLFHWYKRNFKRILADKEARFGMLTLMVPLATIMITTFSVATFVIDKQFQLRFFRAKSVSIREHSLQEEHEVLAQMLSVTEEEFDNKAVPRDPNAPEIPKPILE